MIFDDLILAAKGVHAPRRISENVEVGGVAAALLSVSGKIYTGICLDVPCGIGFCAEHAAIAAMVTAGESKIIRAVAIDHNGAIPPCGRCREFMSQIHKDNIHAEIMIADNKVVKLSELLPHRWDE